MASSNCESSSSHSSSGYCLLADERSDNESAQVVRPSIGSCAYIFEPHAVEKNGTREPDTNCKRGHRSIPTPWAWHEWYVDTPLAYCFSYILCSPNLDEVFLKKSNGLLHVTSASLENARIICLETTYLVSLQPTLTLYLYFASFVVKRLFCRISSTAVWTLYCHVNTIVQYCINTCFFANNTYGTLISI